MGQLGQLESQNTGAVYTHKLTLLNIIKSIGSINLTELTQLTPPLSQLRIFPFACANESDARSKAKRMLFGVTQRRNDV